MSTFVPRGVKEPPVREAARARVRSAHRVFSGSDGFEVAIPETIVERGLELCRRVRPLEWYGAVVATRYRDERGQHVVVRGIVLDPDAEATSGSVRSTPASEAALRRLASLHYPDAVIVGWAHGHPPGAGAFFSSTDRGNQRSWREPDSLSLVFEAEDPKALAVFRGPESEALAPVGRSGNAALGASPAPVPRTGRDVSEAATIESVGRALVRALYVSACAPLVAAAVVGLVALATATEFRAPPPVARGFRRPGPRSDMVERRPLGQPPGERGSQTPWCLAWTEPTSERRDESLASHDAIGAGQEVPDHAARNRHRPVRSRRAVRRSAPPVLRLAH